MIVLVRSVRRLFRRSQHPPLLRICRHTSDWAGTNLFHICCNSLRQTRRRKPQVAEQSVVPCLSTSFLVVKNENDGRLLSPLLSRWLSFLSENAEAVFGLPSSDVPQTSSGVSMGNIGRIRSPPLAAQSETLTKYFSFQGRQAFKNLN